MVQEYFVDQVERINEERQAMLDQVTNQQTAEAYVQSVRARIKECFGAYPDRTPLNARVTSTIERDAYTIENIVFESRPRFYVTANLYIPKGREFPLPGVVGTCGHSTNGKASSYYQSFAQGLARMGYVVLLYDPLGQGERLQYPNEELKSEIGVGVREHLYCGNQQFLVGEFVGMWRAWDGIRALDYLLTREEVDPEHLGVTGNSGGGTMTTWLCGVEQRWTMAAPSCFVTMFERNLENELPADTEQCPPKALALHLEHEDFLAALAPKPIVILAKEKDFFDVRGSEAAHRRLSALYAQFGKEDNIALFTGPTAHGYSQENREAMYQWFNKHTKVSQQQTEPDLKMEEDETLYGAPKGQVVTLDSKPVHAFTKEKAQQLEQQRDKLTEEKLKEAVQDVLRLPECRKIAPHYRILRPHASRDYPKRWASTYAVETEPGIFSIVYYLSEDRLLSRPPQETNQAILYVSHLSSDHELKTEPLIRDILKNAPKAELFTCDVRGVGESMPDTCGNDFFAAYGQDYFYAIHSIMLDYPYVGQKTYDVLCTLGWLHANGYDEVHLVAKGWGSLPATFAGLLAENVKQVTLKHALTSYGDIAQSKYYDWPLSTLVPDILLHFDLPDCYRVLKSKKNLAIIEPWGAEYK
ncbi:prolyl oligopeptidase family serine peptidase [bacterium]|nr:prolyl oligopeptidase family serine peptidase [bacterium]